MVGEAVLFLKQGLDLPEPLVVQFFDGGNQTYFFDVILDELVVFARGRLEFNAAPGKYSQNAVDGLVEVDNELQLLGDVFLCFLELILIVGVSHDGNDDIQHKDRQVNHELDEDKPIPESRYVSPVELTEADVQSLQH